MTSLDSALPSPPFSVVQSLRRAFWRWPSWGEISFFAWNLLATPPGYDSLLDRFTYALAIFLGLRGLDFADKVAETRFPESYGRYRTWLFGLAGGALLIWLIFQFDWNWITSYRPDWRGATGVLIMGAVTVLFVGPPLELWNRALKPFDKRADLTIFQRAGAALTYIVACCIWWAFIVLTIFWVCSQPNLWR